MTELAWRLASGLALLAAGAASPAEVGKAIAEHGNGHGAPPCSACHGPRYAGSTQIKVPPLAGLPEAYLLSRLAHYAGPDGHNTAMRQVAGALSPSERAAVAAYLSALPAAGSGPH